MHKWLIRTTLGLAALGFCSEYAAAQQPSRRAIRGIERPSLTPYLNLIRTDLSGRGGVGSEYFREVRPRFQLRNGIGQGYRASAALGRQQSRTDEQVGTLVRSLTSRLSGTGHSAGFMTHSRYFGTGQR